MSKKAWEKPTDEEWDIKKKPFYKDDLREYLYYEKHADADADRRKLEKQMLEKQMKWGGLVGV